MKYTKTDGGRGTDFAGERLDCTVRLPDDGRFALGTKERRDQEKYFGEGEEPEEDDLVFLRPQAD